MHWTEPASAEDSHSELEKTLWAAANKLWADAALKPSEFSPIVLGLIFLRYAETRFVAAQEEIGDSSGRRKVGPADYHAKGVLYLPEDARFEKLLKLPEGAEMGKAVNDAMRAVEKENPDLADVLPKTYQILENRTLAELLKVMASIPMDKEGDTFGLIYEYFLGKFAMSEGQKGGEFYTPTSIVRLIVDILEPYHGRIYDPACGSGGMFVQSARFVENHHKNPTAEISCHGQERVTETSRLARLNLAVHGLQGDIRQGNTYYEDLHDSVGRFDFVLANPPFNVSKIDKEREAQQLRALIERKLDKMIRLNASRYDFLDRFQKMIEEYNSGAMSIEQLFEELVSLSKDLNDEEQRHLRESVSEEELAVFDILTRPGPDLDPREVEAIKKVCKELLAKLRTELLVLAWREKRTTRAAVRVEIEKMLDSGLPEKYTAELFEQKCGVLFQHVLEKYPERGSSVYEEAV